MSDGFLEVSHGHRLYWECCGPAEGRPAVYLHGGPGAGCGKGARLHFEPGGWRAAFPDQRGSGRSRPLASDPEHDLASQTTQHLVADLEALREHLGFARWAVVGVSWGTTLGLAYAQAHPERVTGLVLALVGTTSRREVEWMTEGVARLFPQAHARFREFVPPELRGLPLVQAYARMLADPDEAVHAPAAREWCAWEEAHVSLSPGHRSDPRFEDPFFRLNFARLVTHYWSHAAFLEEDQLVRDAPRLEGIPGVMICGRYDVSSPLETAWRLQQRWMSSRLVVLEDAGHGDAVSFPEAIRAALASL